MKTITIELINEKALPLLKELEQLRMVRLIMPQKRKQNSKRKWAGSISEETGRKMLQHLNQSRNEWEHV